MGIKTQTNANRRIFNIGRNGEKGRYLGKFLSVFPATVILSVCSPQEDALEVETSYILHTLQDRQCGVSHMTAVPQHP